MKLVRSGSLGVKKNSRVHDLAQEAREALEPILGAALAADVANNAAMAFAFDEDEIFSTATDGDLDTEIAAAAEMLQKTAESENIDLSALSDGQVAELLVDLMPSKTASAAAPTSTPAPTGGEITFAIYEPDVSFADAVRSTLVQRLRHPKTYRAEHLTPEMLEEAVEAIKAMDTDRLGKAVTAFFTAPINEYETPYVSMPEDFTPAEQTEFVELVRQPRFVSRDEQIDKLKEIIARRPERREKSFTSRHTGPRPSDWVTSWPGDRMKRNSSKRASTLNGRPSMDTSHVGRDVDPDRYNGARGKHLEAAMDRYETFHAKRPLRTVELPHDLPTSVVPVGQVISTMYRTDKWHEDGDDEDYKHVHDDSRGGKDREYEFGKGVIAYEPANQVGKSVVTTDGKRSKAKVATKPVRLPVHAPKALSLLGYCLGVFVQRFDDQEVYELNPRGCYLFCSPKGDMLALYSPDKQPDGSSGFLMIMAGGGLRVLKDGIDG